MIVGRKSSSKAQICGSATKARAIPKKRLRPIPVQVTDDTEDDDSDLGVDVKSPPSGASKAKRSRHIVAVIPQAIKIENTKTYCLNSHCQNNCISWLNPGGVHIPLLALSDHVARQMQAAFENINEKYRKCSLKTLYVPAKLAWDSHQEYVKEMVTEHWPPLCAGPHHPDLYETVRVFELGEERLYRVLKLPIPAALISQVVSQLNQCGGPVTSKSRNMDETKRIRRLVHGYLTQDGSWHDNTRVEAITDPRHPVYRETAPAYRLVAREPIKKGAMVGPATYGGILRKTKETDALELDMSGELCDRWAYSFQVAIVTGAVKPSMQKYIRQFVYKDESDEECSTKAGSDPPTVCMRASDWCGGMVGIVDQRDMPNVDDLPRDLSMWDVEGGVFCNELAKANDRRGFGKVLGFEPGEELLPNVQVLNWSLYNLPCIMYIAIRDIREGEEILLDYGQEYWQRQEVMAWCRSENEALKRERARVLSAKEESDKKSELLRTERQMILIELENTRVQLEQAIGAEEQQRIRRTIERLQKAVEIKTNSLEALLKVDEQRKLAIQAVETKNSELKDKLEKFEYACAAKDETLVKMMKDSSQRSIFDSLANTVQTRVSKVCVYSQIAEFIGTGNEHILSVKPERHYASCKYANMPIIAAQVIVCDKCGLHYRGGTHARERHADDCELYREAARVNHQRMLAEAAGYDESVAGGIQHQLGDLAAKAAMAELLTQDELSNVYGQLTNHSILLSMIDLITWNARLTRVWTMLIFSSLRGYARAIQTCRTNLKEEIPTKSEEGEWIKSESGENSNTRPVYNLSQELLRTLCAKELKLEVRDDEHLKDILSNNYELAKILTGPHMSQIIFPNLPKAFLWTVDFAKVFLKYADEFPDIPPDAITDSYLNTLKLHVLKLSDSLDYLDFSHLAKCENVEESATGEIDRSIWSLETNLQLSCTPLENNIRSYYKQFRWPSHPLPKIPNPSAAKAFLERGYNVAQPSSKASPSVVQPAIMHIDASVEEDAVTEFDLNQLELVASYFLLDDLEMKEYESIGKMSKSKTYASFDDDDPRIHLCLEQPDHDGLPGKPPSIDEIEIRSPQKSEWRPHEAWRRLGVVGYDVKDCLVIGSPRRMIQINHEISLHNDRYWSISLLLSCNIEESFLIPQIANRPDINLSNGRFCQIVPLVSGAPPHHVQPIFSVGLFWDRHMVDECFFLLYDFSVNDWIKLSPSFAMESDAARKRTQRNLNQQRGQPHASRPLLPALSRLWIFNRLGRGVEVTEQTSNTKYFADPCKITKKNSISLKSIGFGCFDDQTILRNSSSTLRCPKVIAPLRQTKLSLARCDILEAAGNQ